MATSGGGCRDNVYRSSELVISELWRKLDRPLSFFNTLPTHNTGWLAAPKISCIMRIILFYESHAWESGENFKISLFSNAYQFFVPDCRLKIPFTRLILTLHPEISLIYTWAFLFSTLNYFITAFYDWWVHLFAKFLYKNF